ncbi:cellulose binding domain-containing protein [Lentzea sp. JNUCC 0626]|uniref:cellulose binding domain-containing protein n=1 Tax=Lentzea sp. JNUCC 0626 TaxID=3367513 RepID=UPI0037486880
MAARKHFVVLLTLLVAACTAPQDGRPFPAPRSSPSVDKEPSTKVRTVVDGRTVELADGTRARISRLAEPTSCAAAAATDFATKTLLDKEVRVSSITPGEISLALADGTDYALLAVQYGILRTSGVDGGPLVEAETKASQAKLGLWAQGDCPSSAAQPPSSTAVAPPPASPCVVVYRITSHWAGAFQAEVTIRNVSGALVEGWTVKWRYDGGETVSQLWNGTVSQSGADVSVANAAYNALIVKDGSVTFGFNGAATGPTSPPTAFSVNGAACTVG